MIFQNPFDTLNPSYTVGSQIMRTLERFGIGASRAERRDTMLKLLDLVKLPRAFAERAPRQLSGGQKQRIGVARAFAGRPRLIIADEPMSALDVSVQAAISELLMNLQREARTTMVFISHDLSVVRYLADRVIVMYLGHIVEKGPTRRSSRRPSIPIRRRCCRRSRSPIPRSRSATSFSKAKFPPPCRRRRAARSRPAAVEVASRRRLVRARDAADADRRRGPYDQVPPAGRDARTDGAGLQLTIGAPRL